VIASCFTLLLVVAVTVAVAAPFRRCCCGGDIDIRIGNEKIGSGTVPTLGLCKSMTEQEMIGAGAKNETKAGVARNQHALCKLITLGFTLT